MENATLVNEQSRERLLKSAQWSRYLAIISFVGLALSIIQTVVGIVVGQDGAASGIIGLVISGVITFIMASNLMNYSKLTKLSMETGDGAQLSQAFYHMKIYFTIMGVLCIIMISLLVLGILIALLVGLLQ
jgi:hypothetical protein